MYFPGRQPKSRGWPSELIGEMQRRLAWTEAARDIATLLLEGVEASAAWRLIADKATSLTTIGNCLVVVPCDPGTPLPEVAELVVADSIGARRLGVAEVPVPVDATVRTVFAKRTPLRLASLELNRTSRLSVPVGPVLMLPLLGIDSASGVLVSLRPVGAPPFTDVQLDTMSAFTDRVAVSLALAEARRQIELDTIDERQRIVTDLDDQMMQRLFAAQTALHNVAPHITAPDLFQVSEVIDDLLSLVWPRPTVRTRPDLVDLPATSQL